MRNKARVSAGLSEDSIRWLLGTATIVPGRPRRRHSKIFLYTCQADRLSSKQCFDTTGKLFFSFLKGEQEGALIILSTKITKCEASKGISFEKVEAANIPSNLPDRLLQNSKERRGF